LDLKRKGYGADAKLGSQAEFIPQQHGSLGDELETPG
jgi:hypothetical protein